MLFFDNSDCTADVKFPYCVCSSTTKTVFRFLSVSQNLFEIGLDLNKSIKYFVYLNIVFIIAVTIFIIFSKKNEPKVFPEKFSKKYILKYPRL